MLELPTMNKSIDPTINERAQSFLRLVIERYIRDGQPVGSRTLAEESAMGLSSATIRNILAELEDRGYLRSPHTSAGRVPTVQGYRFFVNALLTTQQLTIPGLEQVKNQLTSNLDVSELVTLASNILSDLTSLMGLVMLPRRESSILRHIEFLPLSDNRVLVILVLNERDVQNRILHTERVYRVEELQYAANYLTATYAGQDISRIKEHLLQSLQEERNQLNYLMQAAIEVATKVLDSTKSSDDYVVAGQTRLFDLADVS